MLIFSKKVLVIFSVAGLFVWPGTARSQDQVIDLTRLERTRIKQYVAKEKISPATSKEQIDIGTVLGGDVLLRPPPRQWGPRLVKYQYIYHGSQIMLVDPSTRKVMLVVK
jgi:Protein of unknown function (DUF1236)